MNSIFTRHQSILPALILWYLLSVLPAAASDFDCNIAFSKCELQARSTPIKTPCDEAQRCEALALCDLEFCICRRAGSGHLGGLGYDVDPALVNEARAICGLTHGRVGKCEAIAKKCISFMRKQYQESHGNQESSHKPPPKPKPQGQDDCNPNFDPENIRGENDRPCIR